MAGESSLCDNQHNVAVLRSLFKQKNELSFCDVIMKVCGKEIYAHSNVLAAASPYFQAFFGQDLPRQHSQRSPQVIEIQIDGSEPFYDEAVSAVIDFIYTGVLSVRNDNVAQIAEIAKIMHMWDLIKFCNDFSLGNVNEGDFIVGESVKHHKSINTMTFLADSIRTRIKGKRLKSVSTQVLPTMFNRSIPGEIERKDQGTSTERWPQSRVDTGRVYRKRGRPRKIQPPILLPVETVETDTEGGEIEAVVEVYNEEDTETTERDETKRDEAERDEAERYETAATSKISDDQNASANIESQGSDKDINTESRGSDKDIDPDNDNPTEEIQTKQNSPEIEDGEPSLETYEEDEVIPNTEDQTEEENETDVEEVEFSVGRSARSGRIRKLPSKLRDMAGGVHNLHGSEIEFIMKASERDVKKEPEENEREEALDTDVSESDVKSEKKVNTKDSNDDSLSELMPSRKKFKYGHRRTQQGTDILDDVGPKMRKYSCDTCDFMTNKVREMSSHRKLHKFEQNTCYYCDHKFNTREELTSHIEKHKGPDPFFCPTCHMRFRTRTMFNMHLPKHSNEKPFICEKCSAGFKWKHALKGHMITHSNKKEHLCDVCGYATAHKSQLKAHRLIHTGDLFRCDFADCDFQCTKKQNLKYHIYTHTGEKPHQCDQCGQSFSLVKNMRRHMLLHGQDKSFKCDNCDFASTRFDKLKEHRLKQHGFGTAPEKRIRTGDMRFQHLISPSKLKFEGVSGGEEEQEDGVEGGEDDHAAVILQALDEEHMAEIERHVAQSSVLGGSNVMNQPNILFQMRHPTTDSNKPKTSQANMYQKIVTFQTDQVMAGTSTMQQSELILHSHNIDEHSQQQITLSNQIQNSDNLMMVGSDSVSVSDGSTSHQPKQQYIITNTDGGYNILLGGETATAAYMGQPQGAATATAYMTADGTIVQLDPGTILHSTDDDGGSSGHVIAQQLRTSAGIVEEADVSGAYITEEQGVEEGIDERMEYLEEEGDIGDDGGQHHEHEQQYFTEDIIHADQHDQGMQIQFIEEGGGELIAEEQDELMGGGDVLGHEGGDDVEYAEIMIQDAAQVGDGGVVHAYTEEGEQISL